MDDTLTTLKEIIQATPGAAAQLAIAHAAAHDGRHAEALVHCSIAADGIAAIHEIDDPIMLAKALGRLMLE